MTAPGPLASFTFWVHVQPRATSTDIVGRHGDAIKVRVKAPPVDGAANDALVRFLARRLEVPRKAITIEGGATARRKRIRVTGLTRSDGMLLLGVPDD